MLDDPYAFDTAVWKMRMYWGRAITDPRALVTAPDPEPHDPLTINGHIARLDVILMREFLARNADRPEVEDCVWLMNLPKGPSAEGRGALSVIVQAYGQDNVTTGTAQPPSVDEIGVFVRRADASGD